MAAHTTGGHSSLSVLLGIVIVVWGFVSVTALLAWISRAAGRHRERRGALQNRSLITRLRSRARHGAPAGHSDAHGAHQGAAAAIGHDAGQPRD